MPVSVSHRKVCCHDGVEFTFARLRVGRRSGRFWCLRRLSCNLHYHLKTFQCSTPSHSGHLAVLPASDLRKWSVTLLQTEGSTQFVRPWHYPLWYLTDIMILLHLLQQTQCVEYNLVSKVYHIHFLTSGWQRHYCDWERIPSARRSPDAAEYQEKSSLIHSRLSEYHHLIRFTWSREVMINFWVLDGIFYKFYLNTYQDHNTCQFICPCMTRSQGLIKPNRLSFDISNPVFLLSISNALLIASVDRQISHLYDGFNAIQTDTADAADTNHASISNSLTCM